MSALEDIARALPGVDEALACAGTSLESRTFRVKKKAFLFISKEHARFKLERSIADAKKRGAEVGAGGWAKLALNDLPARSVLAKWIEESHALIGGGDSQAATARSKPARAKNSGPVRSRGR